MDLENRLVVAQGEGEGVGGIGSLGLMDANYCFWNVLTMISCCVALRTKSRYLQCSMTMEEKIMYTCMCNWVPRLYSEKKKCVGEITIKINFKKVIYKQFFCGTSSLKYGLKQNKYSVSQ